MSVVVDPAKTGLAPSVMYPIVAGAGLNGVLYSAVSSITVTNAGPTSLLSAGSAGSPGVVLPQSFFNKAGNKLIAEFSGTLTSGSATPTMNLIAKLGATQMAATGAGGLSTSVGAKAITIRVVLTVRVPGASATFDCHIEYWWTTGATTLNSLGADDTSGTVDTTTGTQTFDLTATTAAGTGNTTLIITQGEVRTSGV